MNKIAISLAVFFSSAPLLAAQGGALLLPSAADIARQCQQTISQAKEKMAALEKLPLAKVNAANTLGEWNRINQNLDHFGGPMGLLSEVSPSAPVRTAADACNLKMSALISEVLQSEALYNRFKALKPKDAIDAEAKADLLSYFEDRGVNLSKEKRKELAAIFNKIEKLQQDFSRNMRDNQARISFMAEELKGVSASFLESAKKDAAGQYVLGFDYPEIDAVMGYAENEASRERYYIGRMKIGGAANLQILKEVVELRKKIAQLAGYSSYAAFAIRNKMAATPEAVNTFLADVQTRVTALEKSDIEELRQEKIRFTGKADSVLKRWDVQFYEEQLKARRYQLDQKQVREQFPTEPTIAWMMNVTGTLYGVDFRPNAQLKTWHKEVRAYDVFDRSSKKYLSSFYLDLFPRDGKYKHAAAFPVRGVSSLSGQTPVSVLVTNFSREGFNQNELETLYHEFGHIMHGVLSKTRYTMHAGTSVKRDFVEAPSQMYEEWARRPEAEALFNDTCSSCKPIDPQLIAKMDEARRFGRGLKYARQVLYSAYDMALAAADAADPLAVWQKMEGKTPLGYVAGTEFPGTFGHIVGGYAAGYYGYMWSEVLALDMLSAFGSNVMDVQQGKRYRELILENGGQRPAMELVEEFIGRKPNADAFFQEISGQRGVAAKAAE
ncbi:M3 family metallopeptidase [Iodobacter ciconiae]|uniref:Zn-dependent oligopeptidase n=1 Tax=Iodobacter ciconiae TaxID=2496266 RepID=A0A3S8ZQZ1_9NEIS|nr:M3 family metallopeptidase [Iodobacter ciconiae]AZN35815.1 Zn-dependent oligopeptidase [Iodobacter ciconiae]